MNQPKTIVTITPVAVQRDSRAFKQAASVARFGYRSILVEGETSHLEGVSLLFELRHASHPRKQVSAIVNHSQTPALPGPVNRNSGTRSRLERRVASLPWFVRPPLQFAYNLIRFLLHLLHYSYHEILLPFVTIPKASLYYLHAPYQFPAVYLRSWIHSTPMIYDAHDFYTGIEREEDLSSYERYWTHPFYRKIETLCFNHAAAVVTASEGFAQLQKELFGTNATVIRNCHDSRLDRALPQHIRQQLGLDSDVFLLVTIGNAKRGQAIVEALDAMAALPSHVHLAFLGRGYGSYLDSIQARRIQGRVHMVPPINPFEVVPFVKSADLSLLLYYSYSVNYKQTLPNGLFQSVAAELPLLYPELPGIGQIAAEYRLGLPIDPRSPASISAAVSSLMNNPDRLAVFKENVRAARQNLSWEREETILRDLVAGISP